MYLGTCQLILQHIILWPFEKLASDWSWENDTSQHTLYGVGMTLGYLCYITKIDISSKYLRWMLRKIAHFHLLSYVVAANCPFKQIV